MHDPEKFTLIPALVFVSLGKVATSWRWGGWNNLIFARDKFLVVIVKKLLKSVHIYRSYRQNKPGGSFFGTPGTCCRFVWCHFHC